MCREFMGVMVLSRSQGLQVENEEFSLCHDVDVGNLERHSPSYYFLTFFSRCKVERHTHSMWKGTLLCNSSRRIWKGTLLCLCSSWRCAT
ncbi:uncharacterized protein DS421_9g263650 [Arachis hypogaea]|nr:uncharacterized protein DS421_9g263650 [Arachis hypogaea]